MFSTPHAKGPELFTRAAENPLLTPTSRWWESVAVFNPGVAEDAAGRLHILYRAVGRDGISRCGYATSRDGVTIETRSLEPVLEPDLHDEYERLGIEDPRLTLLNGIFHVTYTAASVYAMTDARRISETETPWRVRVALALTEDFQTFSRFGVILPDMDNKDAVLFPEKLEGKYVLLHRLPPDIWISTSDDLREWGNHRAVVRTRPAFWDERKLGAGAPPLRVDEGWLLAYHGSDHHNVYRAGFLLLDARDPSIVLGRSDVPALGPKAPYEVDGSVPRVVFPTGLIRRGDSLLLYYGAGDRVVAVARGLLKDVINSLR